MSIPTTARTGKHRVNLRYVNKGLDFELARDLYFDVINDGSWQTHPLIEAMRESHPSVAILQGGMPCQALGVRAYGGGEDTWMYAPSGVPDQNNAHVNYGTVDHLSVGRYGLVSRALVRFDLECVPKGARVSRACLQLYLFARRRPEAVEAYEVLRPWGAGRGTGSRWAKLPVAEGEASWNCSQHPAKWYSAGCSAPGRDRSERPAGGGPPIAEAKGWVTVELDPELVRRWIDDPSANHGLMLKDKAEGSGSECKYRSADFEDPPMRPRLVLAFAKRP